MLRANFFDVLWVNWDRGEFCGSNIWIFYQKHILKFISTKEGFKRIFQYWKHNLLDKNIYFRIYNYIIFEIYPEINNFLYIIKLIRYHKPGDHKIKNWLVLLLIPLKKIPWNGTHVDLLYHKISIPWISSKNPSNRWHQTTKKIEPKKILPKRRWLFGQMILFENIFTFFGVFLYK